MTPMVLIFDVDKQGMECLEVFIALLARIDHRRRRVIAAGDLKRLGWWRNRVVEQGFTEGVELYNTGGLHAETADRLRVKAVELLCAEPWLCNWQWYIVSRRLTLTSLVKRLREQGMRVEFYAAITPEVADILARPRIEPVPGLYHLARGIQESPSRNRDIDRMEH